MIIICVCYSYECDCSETGFEGDHCEVDIAECASDPCQHGATCLEGVKGYTCLCWPGTGTTCYTSNISVPTEGQVRVLSGANWSAVQVLLSLEAAGFHQTTISYMGSLLDSHSCPQTRNQLTCMHITLCSPSYSQRTHETAVIHCNSGRISIFALHQDIESNRLS